MNITVPMFEKGRAFVAAAALLKANEGHDLVSAHLFCQGFECIGKAILLKKDYEQYSDKLRKEFGHNLLKLFSEVNGLYGNELFSAEAKSDLISLNQYYQSHDLRYGSTIDSGSVDTLISFNSLHHELISILSRRDELVGS